MCASDPLDESTRRRLTDVHRAMDSAIGRVIGALPEHTTVVVCSVHGTMKQR